MNEDFFENYEQSPEGADLAADFEDSAVINAIVSRAEAAHQDARGWIGRAWEAWAWWDGRHYSKWVHETENLVDLDFEYADQTRITLNYIRTATEKVLSKLVAHDPGWDVSPATSDEDDVDSARASDDLLAHYHRELEGRHRITRFARAGLVTGLGVMRVHWDKLGGEPVQARDENGSPLVGDDGQPLMVMSGTPRLTEIPATTWFCDGGSEPDMSDIRWCVEMTWLHIEDIRETWPKTGQRVVPSTAIGVDPLLTDVFDTQHHRPVKSVPDERALVYRYYEVPSTAYPKGRYVACTDSVLLESIDALPGRGRLPFAVFSVWALPGGLRGRGKVADLKPLNAQINRQESKRSELVDLHANPKVIVEEGSIRKNQWTNEAGEIVEVAKNARRPEIMPPPPISPQHEAIVTQYLAHMTALSGASDLVPGSASAAASGRRLQFEDELAAAQLLTISTDLELAVKRMGSLILELCQENLPPEMMIRVLGQDGRLMARRFYASSIRSTDVQIEVGSMQLRHPSIVAEKVMAAYERNIFGDRNDPKVQRAARKMMEFGADKYLEGDRTRDRDYQREENYAMANGLVSGVMPNEDHEIHIDELNSYMASVEFRNLAPEIRQRFLVHLAEHMAYQAAAANGQPWWTSYVSPDLAAMAYPQGVAPPAPPEGAPPPPMMQLDPFGLDPADAAAMQAGAMQNVATAMGRADAGRGLPTGQPPSDAPPIKMSGMQTPPSGAAGWGVG